MSAVVARPFIEFVKQTQQHRKAHRTAWRSCLESSWTETWQATCGYPSPPMSNPPSPPKLTGESSTTATSGNVTQAFASATIVPLALAEIVGTPVATPAVNRPLVSTNQTPDQPPQGLTGVIYPPFGSAPVATEASHDAEQASAQNETPAANPFGASSSLTALSGPSSSRGGRKSKAHVASACVNCKRAHLSCDVQRPCARCVTSGKQDTCFDVQHKKRGRPRLRDESEFRIEPVSPEQHTQPSMSAPTAPAVESPPRPMARAGHRRTESFRTLRSQVADPSVPLGGPQPQYSGSTTGSSTYTPYGTQFVPQSPEIQQTTTPTAFLDLDLVILRVNQSFHDFLQSIRDLVGARLSDLINPMDEHNLQAIKNDLRAERESRDPSYLPPILQAGQDPLQGVSESDIERLSSGFTQRNYTWSYRRTDGLDQPFPVRIRLAKAAIYFIAVTIPMAGQVPAPQYVTQSYQTSTPQQQQGGSYFPLPPSSTDVYARPSSTLSHSAPASPYYQFQNVLAPVPSPYGTGQAMASRTYPPPLMPMPYQSQPYPPYQSASPPAPRLQAAEPPATTVSSDPFTPRSAPLVMAHSDAIQLPPIAGSSAMPSQAAADVGQTGSSEEEDAGPNASPRSTRKRRRMQIGDVLQR